MHAYSGVIPIHEPPSMDGDIGKIYRHYYLILVTTPSLLDWTAIFIIGVTRIGI